MREQDDCWAQNDTSVGEISLVNNVVSIEGLGTFEIEKPTEADRHAHTVDDECNVISIRFKTVQEYDEGQ